MDQIVDIIGSDAKLAQGTSSADIQAGMEAAAAMNALVIEAIINTGVADDGSFSAQDVIALNGYLLDNYADEWVVLHGDDENGVETGYHLVQGDGAKTLLYGSNAVDKVADSIYHLGFELTGRSRLSDEDGNGNQSVDTVAHWMNLLLADDLADGSLHSGKPQSSQVVLTVSNAGEPIPFQDPDFLRYYNDDLDAGDDMVSGSSGADTFRFQFNMMATPDIAAKHVMQNGMIHWGGVAGENANVHDHFVHSGGDDVVLDYNAIEGDSIEIVGHTTNFWLSYDDVDGNGKMDTVIHVYSDQGGYDVDANGNFTGNPNGAHDGDDLGSVTILNVKLFADEIYNDSNTHYGAYDTLNQIPDPDNPRPYVIPTDGPKPDPIDDTSGQPVVGPVASIATGSNQLVQIDDSDTVLAQGTSSDDISAGMGAGASMNGTTVQATRKTGVADDGASTLPFAANAVNRLADSLFQVGVEVNGLSRLADDDGDGSTSIDVVAEWMTQLVADDLVYGGLII